MEYRRKNLEDKQKAIEAKRNEEIQREIRKNKLKERVTQSRYLLDNSKKLEETRKNKQIQFKENLKNLKVNYLQELEKRKQKVYNKPLMFEQETSSVNKLNKLKKTMNTVGECMNDNNDYNENFDNLNNCDINNNNTYTGESLNNNDNKCIEGEILSNSNCNLNK